MAYVLFILVGGGWLFYRYLGTMIAFAGSAVYLILVFFVLAAILFLLVKSLLGIYISSEKVSAFWRMREFIPNFRVGEKLEA